MRLVTIALALLLGGCAAGGAANYPSYEGVFGRIDRAEEGAVVIREAGSQALLPGSSLYVGDTVLTGELGGAQITLAPGQVIRLGPVSRWQIEKVISNGAAFGSNSQLTQGTIHVAGEEYMPHRIIITTSLAIITTYSENFRVIYKGTEGGLSVVSLDSTSINVATNSVSETLNERLQMVSITPLALPLVSRLSDKEAADLR